MPKTPNKEKKSSAAPVVKKTDTKVGPSKQDKARPGVPQVLACQCQHSAQDQFYGVGRRLHTAKKGGGGFTCTVCGAKK
jgi:hypothetical protein